MDNYEIMRIKRKINRLINRRLLDGKYIVLFGASAASKEVKTCLRERGINPHAVIDNDERKVGKECLGLTIQKPEALLSPFNDSVAILLCSAGFYREMTLQLNVLGYRNNKHIFCLNFKTDESLPIFFYNIARMSRGWFAYRRLIQKSSGGQILFIAPYTGTGDIYLVGLFFQEYLKRNNITQYTFIVVSGACRKVAEMFGIQNIKVVSRLLVDDIINCDRALRAGWPLVILNDSWAAEYTNLLQWIRGYKDLSFDKMFRYFVFGFNDDVAYQLPPPASSKTDIETLFRKHGLAEGRTVVLSPYSNTLFELPDDVWKTVVDYCKQRGYTVCTNCAGAGETPIEGTAAVFFPLGQAIEFLNAAGYFIGVRSGLCDIISSSSCKKIILYEKDGFFYKCSPYDYFSLRKMNLCDDAVELEYGSDRKDKVLDEILKMF
jgi:hypothetical protein